MIKRALNKFVFVVSIGISIGLIIWSIIYLIHKVIDSFGQTGVIVLIGAIVIVTLFICFLVASIEKEEEALFWPPKPKAQYCILNGDELILSETNEKIKVDDILAIWKLHERDLTFTIMLKTKAKIYRIYNTPEVLMHIESEILKKK